MVAGCMLLDWLCEWAGVCLDTGSAYSAGKLAIHEAA